MPKVTLVKGDGIGPEIAEAAVFVIDALGLPIEWEERPAGAAAIPEFGAPLPPSTIESIRANRFALKGPLHTPVGGGYKSANVALRQELELFANIRPVRSFEGVETPFRNVDLVVVRENTQGLYSGIEFHTDIRKTSAQAVALITRPASERVIRFAFEHARATQRKKVTLVHKANILKFTSGMFLEIGREIATQYPDIQFEDRIIDAMAMALVMKPQTFELIVTTNLFGDILSDLTAGLVGGLGLAPSANIGEEVGLFEAVHGTAPDIAGKGIANPSALILSGAMMLRRLGHAVEAQRVRKAVQKTLRERKVLTPDLGGSAKTMEYAKAIVANFE